MRRFIDGVVFRSSDCDELPVEMWVDVDDAPEACGVQCPTCGAEPGVGCSSRKGHEYMTRVHEARTRTLARACHAPR